MAFPDDACDDRFADPGSRTVPPTASGGDVHRAPQSETVTQILSQIASGDRLAAEQLLPLVYDELRQLAAAKMAREKPGQTLQATALVHEAYLRLVNREENPRWESQGHFFAAAARAMRRILVESARAKRTRRRGGNGRRVELLEIDAAVGPTPDHVLDLDAALAKLARTDPRAAKLVDLRVFAGMTIREVADYLGISPHQAKRLWAYARAWLRREIQRGGLSAG
jgi:RNA polymerase sigma factor (TIGR02999 family)